MKLGLVLGPVIASRNTGDVEGKKILVVRELNDDLSETSKTNAVIDSVGAGKGDIVLICASSSARKTAVTNGICCDNAIVAIVDRLSFGKKDIYVK